MEHLLKGCKEIEIILNCYLTKPAKKDIDNLAKVPIDVLFFSAKNEKGAKENWEGKITSQIVRKLKSSQDMLEIILNEVDSAVN